MSTAGQFLFRRTLPALILSVDAAAHRQVTAFRQERSHGSNEEVGSPERVLNEWTADPEVRNGRAGG
jgi:hypothetical protein